MFEMKICYFLVGIFPLETNCFYPPSYNVKLNQDETFVISEPLGSGDVNDVYQEEEEMIKREQLDRMKYEANADKYYRIHKHVFKDDGIKGIAVENNYKHTELNLDLEDPAPWRAGFVGPDGHFIEDRDKSGSNTSNKLLKRKRDDDPTNQNYDYSQLKSEYNNDIKLAQKAKDTLNFTETKEDETFQEAAKSLVTFEKTPRNCTEEEIRSIGLAAVECFWIELNKPKLKAKKLWLLEKLLRLILIWLCVYIFIAIPLWCQKGWCCCCCFCKFCKPLEQIDEAKKFFAENPLGVYHDEQNNKLTYQPTHYEAYAQKNLEQAIRKL